jgi:hypothetical protein
MADSQGSESKLEEILSKVRDIKVVVTGNATEKAPEKIPLIDPTANVKELVEMGRRHSADLRLADNKRLDDLRAMKDECDREKDALKEQLREAESKRIDAVNLAERSRIDANVAQGKADIALASEKAAATAITLASAVVASAKALSDTAASTTASQDRRLSALEQSQNVGVGVVGQRIEGRQQYQWLIGAALVVIALIVNHLWK